MSKAVLNKVTKTVMVPKQEEVEDSVTLTLSPEEARDVMLVLGACCGDYALGVYSSLYEVLGKQNLTYGRNGEQFRGRQVYAKNGRAILTIDAGSAGLWKQRD